MIARFAAALVLASGLGLAATSLAAPAFAENAARAPQARAADGAVDVSAQRRRPRGTRLRVYRPSRQLPPDAVRPCVARLVPEHRVSGTVIVPRMTCWWQRG